jgi:2'-5' RNA ligase superfamily
VRPTESAVIVAIPEAEDVVGPHRAALDPAAGRGVQAHVTVLYPFVPPAKIDDRVIRALADALQTVPAFGITFSRVAWLAMRCLAGARARPTVPETHQRCLGPLPRLPAVPRKACRADSASHHRRHRACRSPARRCQGGRTAPADRGVHQDRLGHPRQRRTRVLADRRRTLAREVITTRRVQGSAEPKSWSSHASHRSLLIEPIWQINRLPLRAESATIDGVSRMRWLQGGLLTMDGTLRDAR